MATGEHLVAAHPRRRMRRVATNFDGESTMERTPCPPRCRDRGPTCQRIWSRFQRCGALVKWLLNPPLQLCCRLDCLSVKFQTPLFFLLLILSLYLLSLLALRAEYEATGLRIENRGSMEAITKEGHFPTNDPLACHPCIGLVATSDVLSASGFLAYVVIYCFWLPSHMSSLMKI